MGRHGGALILILTLIAAAAVAASPEEAVEMEVTAPAQHAPEVDPAAQQEHLLPRVLVIELPSSAEAVVEMTAPAQHASEAGPAADPHVIELPSSSSAPSYEEGLEAVPTDVRCASWRLAAEANNLAPWRAVPAECADHVRDYVTGVAYRSDLDLVARESAAYARAAQLGADGRDVWVFDIDETLLSNLPYYAEHGYGLELFDHCAFDKWVETAEAPAIPSSLKLYKEVRELGFKTFLLTGRSEAHKGVTVENLKKQGFHDWDKLILRATVDRNKTATTYKSEKRKEMEAEGYRILGNSGDQWSDLLGSSVAARSFKLPNPMYYIP